MALVDPYCIIIFAWKIAARPKLCGKQHLKRPLFPLRTYGPFDKRVFASLMKKVWTRITQIMDCNSEFVFCRISLDRHHSGNLHQYVRNVNNFMD